MLQGGLSAVTYRNLAESLECAVANPYLRGMGTNTSTVQAQNNYDAKREMRRIAKLKRQHECYEESYAEAAKQLSTEPWFLALSNDQKDKRTCFLAVEIYLSKDCSK